MTACTIEEPENGQCHRKERRKKLTKRKRLSMFRFSELRVKLQADGVVVSPCSPSRGVCTYYTLAIHSDSSRVFFCVCLPLRLLLFLLPLLPRRCHQEGAEKPSFLVFLCLFFYFLFPCLPAAVDPWPQAPYEWIPSAYPSAV